VVGTIRLGGKPEFAVSAGDGMLYAEMMLTGWPRSLVTEKRRDLSSTWMVLRWL